MSQKLSHLLDILSDENELVALLAELASVYKQLHEVVTALMSVNYDNQNKYYDVISPKQKRVGEIVGKLQAMRPAKYLIMLDNLTNALQELSQSEGQDLQTFSTIKMKIQNFYQEFERSINNFTWPQTMNLLLAADDLHDSILTYRDFVSLMKEDLESPIDIPEDNKVASFFFTPP
jgi:negative regulator of sigma E activity